MNGTHPPIRRQAPHSVALFRDVSRRHRNRRKLSGARTREPRQRRDLEHRNPKDKNGQKRPRDRTVALFDHERACLADGSEKVEAVVGLYMDPPAHAVVVSIDEKSQIQALDRTQPGLPLKPAKCGAMAHGYKRNGTTTLFAALNILDRIVIGRCMNKHRHQEFIRFLNSVDRAVPSGKLIHAVIDNYATHKHPNVLKCIHDGPSTSPRRPPPGSTPSKGFSRRSRAEESGAASSNPLPNSKTPSRATSRRITRRPRPSSGPQRVYADDKGRARFLKKLCPPPPEIWELRTTEPRVQARMFCRFTEPDTLIATKFYTRGLLGNKQSRSHEWQKAMLSCEQDWNNLFPGIVPFSGKSIHEYVTEN